MIFSCLRCGKKEDDDRDRLKKKLKEKKTEVGEQYSIDVQMRSGLVFPVVEIYPGVGTFGFDPWMRWTTETVRQAVTLSQGYQKATMGRMSNLTCLKHGRINRWKNFLSPTDEFFEYLALVYLLDILSECEIEPFSGPIRIVLEEEMVVSPEAKRKLWLPRSPKSRGGGRVTKFRRGGDREEYLARVQRRLLQK